MSYIDTAINATTIIGIAYILFTWFEFGFRKPQPAECEAVEPEPQINQPTAAKAMPAQRVAVVKVEQSSVKEVEVVVGAKTEMTIKELRALCNQRGIRWNRAGEGGKRHLRRGEMMAALGL